MNAEQISYGQTLDIARHLLPVMLSRTALKIFPKWKTADMSSKQIVAVICRNLLFYQIQLMSRNYAAEPDCSNSTIFLSYASALRKFLLQESDLELYLCRVNYGLTDSEAARIEASLRHLPAVPDKVPQYIRVIQGYLTRLFCMFELPPDELKLALYDLQADWQESLCRFPMQLISARYSLELARNENNRNLSRQRNGLKRRLQWGKEFHNYYQFHLAAGCCDQTAKKLARTDFIKAHPISGTAEEAVDFPNMPGHHRCSLLSYHRAYLKSLGSVPESLEL